ncbi:MAG: 2Fe-2S iron-sulfur cluster binding domain-containing protein [Gammaproteobacteria bacterium]|nr:2Fe-2S iron-sulfur cluster binding domain-containing protein [Gammaproteobacteria bacterium]
MVDIEKHQITLLPSGVVFEGSSEKTILDSALEVGIALEHSCKTGTCGVCKAKVILSEGNELGESVLLTCQAMPSCDLTLHAEYYPELASIKCITAPAKVNSILYESEDIITLELRLPPKNKFDFLPGQYLDLKYQGIARSYSIASIPNEKNTIELHFKRVLGGKMSEKIFSPIKENQLLQVEGPKGTFFFHNKKTGPIIFIATGTGFAPVKAMISKLVKDQQLDRPIHIYWGNRSSDLFYDKPVLLNWSEQFDFIKPELCLSKAEENWFGRIGYVQNCVIEDEVSLCDAEVYACGSIEMIESAKSLLVSAGLDRDSFYSDAFVAS